MKIMFGFAVCALLVSCSKSNDTNSDNGNNNTPSSEQVVDKDGNSYPTIKTCYKTWMAKNLNVSKYRNGDPIPQITDPSKWLTTKTGAWCYLNNDPKYGEVYGKLYNWYAVTDPRGIAPEGWRVPTTEEYNSLAKCLGEAAGTKMKKDTTLWKDLDNCGTYFNIKRNESGFSAIPAGALNSNTFGSTGFSVDFWTTSTSNDQIGAISFGLDADYCDYWNLTTNKESFFSVRCVKD